MKMDEDNRPDDNSEEEESDAGWYFDLPKGAWERQEAKNRELRQTLRRNMDAEPAKREAFGPREEGRDLRQEDEPPSWRALQGDKSDPEEASGAGWSLPAGTFDEPEEDSPIEYSTEPEPAAEIPLKLRSRRLPDEDPQPALKPPPGLFGHDESQESPWSAEPDAADTTPPQPRRFATRPTNEEEEARPFVRGDLPPAPPPVEHQSRWGEIFSEKASDGATMLEGMRAWAKSSDSDPAENPSAEEPVGPSASGHEDEHGQPGSPAPMPIRVQRHEDDEPPLVNTENPTTRWDQMFGRTAAEDAGLLDGMRAWATKADDDEQADAPPRMRLAGEPEEADETLFKPFEWEQGTPSASRHDIAAPEEDPAEKKGLLGKLFGKKKKADETEPPHRTAGDAPWASDDDAPEGFPAGLSFGGLEESESRGSWLGRSDASENRFAVPDDTAAWPPASNLPPADSPWKLDEEDVDTRGRRFDHGVADEEPEWAPESPTEEPAAEGPASSITAPAWAFAREDRASADAPGTPPAWDPLAPAQTTADDAGWSPEPFDTPAAPAPAADAEWPADEPTPASRATGLSPVADEDPWRSVDEADGEDAPPSAVPAEPDDPWAAFVASREEAQPEAAVSRTPQPADGEDAGAVDDDDASEEGTPWAAIAASGVGGGTAAATVSGALSDADEDAPEDAPSAKPALWDSAFARVHDSQLEEEAADAAEDEAPPVDDPWAAIAEASGVEPGSSEIAIFRGSAEVEDALERYEAEREAEEAVEATEPEAFPAAIDPEAAPSAAELPAWDDSEVDDDTVLRAFEAHASLYDDDDEELPEMPPPATDTDPVVFGELLGEDADEIVAEASQQSAENRYMGRMHGWAPQRSNAPGGRQVFPWETDTDEPDRERPVSDSDDEPALEGWSRVEEPPPPWATSPAAAHADAPSVRRKSRSRMLVREIVETGLLALLVFLAVRASFQNFKVDGLSMYPTLEDGEYLIVNKLAYSEIDMDRLGNFVPFVEAGDDPTREVFGGPERGDIVVLQDPREEDVDLIKRIIGLPGETIEIVDGEVYINDFLLEEPYIKQEWDDTKDKILIPEGFYFVMGDNRGNSLDSRNDGPNGIGLISKDLIIGKAALTYWPRSKFGLAPNESGDISEKDGRPTITAQKLDD